MHKEKKTVRTTGNLKGGKTSDSGVHEITGEILKYGEQTIDKWIPLARKGWGGWQMVHGTP